MGRAPCCDKANVKKGPWSPDEDEKLKSYIDTHGTGGNWITLPQKIGLKRCGKSCRLRWLNYLRPNIKHGAFSDEEDTIICSLYIAIGSRWSIIAAQLPGRTDNDIKNHWNTKLKTMLLGKHRKNQKIRVRACNYNATMINKAANNMQAAINASPAPLYSTTPHEEASSNTLLLHSDDHVMKFPIYQAQVAPSFTIPHLEPTTMPAGFSWIHESSFLNDATPTWQGHVCTHEEGGYYGSGTMKVEGMNCLYQGMKESFVWSTNAIEMMNSYDEKLYMATE